VEREGSDANILMAVAAAIGDEVIGQLATLAAGSFLDSAAGDQLDRLVFDRYGIVRKSASASLGTVQFTSAGGAGTTFTIPPGITLQTADGIQFVTAESAIFSAASFGPVNVACNSVLAGASQNVKAGAITSITKAITSQPTDLKVSNPFATAGGDDAESDDSLRDRGRRFFTTVRRGTMGALEEAALAVPGVRKATAFEVIDSLGRPARLVQLVVADAFTEQFVNYDTVPARYQVQSQLLAATVFSSLNDVRAAGTFIQVFVANVVLQAIQLSLTFNAGADVNQAALSARSAVVTYVNGLAPGSPFVLKNALDVMRLTPGLATSGNNIIAPAGDVAVKPLQVIRTSLGLVSALASQTSQPLATGSNPDSYVLANG
jgi:uncharacterized phage protein gp47/JayE